jgi:hypothetical protein
VILPSFEELARKCKGHSHKCTSAFIAPGMLVAHFISTG